LFWLLRLTAAQELGFGSLGRLIEVKIDVMC